MFNLYVNDGELSIGLRDFDGQNWQWDGPSDTKVDNIVFISSSLVLNPSWKFRYQSPGLTPLSPSNPIWATPGPMGTASSFALTDRYDEIVAHDGFNHLKRC